MLKIYSFVETDYEDDHGVCSYCKKELYCCGCKGGI